MKYDAALVHLATHFYFLGDGVEFSSNLIGGTTSGNGSGLLEAHSVIGKYSDNWREPPRPYMFHVEFEGLQAQNPHHLTNNNIKNSREDGSNRGDSGEAEHINMKNIRWVVVEQLGYKVCRS